MRERIAMHGRDHRPGGADPITGFDLEFISLEQAIVGLNANGTSTSGTDASGIVFFTAGPQKTNVGGSYASHTPPVDVTGSALSFDTGSADQISLNIPGTYMVQRQYLVNTIGGVSPFFVHWNGDLNALGFGGGHHYYASGAYNVVSAHLAQMIWFDGGTFTLPYLLNTGLLSDSATPHDVIFRVSVAYLGS